MGWWLGAVSDVVGVDRVIVVAGADRVARRGAKWHGADRYETSTMRWGSDVFDERVLMCAIWVI